MDYTPKTMLKYFASKDYLQASIIVAPFAFVVFKYFDHTGSVHEWWYYASAALGGVWMSLASRLLVALAAALDRITVAAYLRVKKALRASAVANCRCRMASYTDEQKARLDAAVNRYVGLNDKPEPLTERESKALKVAMLLLKRGEFDLAMRCIAEKPDSELKADLRAYISANTNGG